MNLRHLAVAASIAFAANMGVVLPMTGWLEGLSIDSLFWLRQAAFGPRHDPAESPAVVVALDEETYRRPPFEDLPKVMWTKQIAAVLDAVLAGGARVVGFDVIFPTSVERNLRGYDREFLIALRKASRNDQVVLGKVQHQQKPISPFSGYSFAVGHQNNIRSVNVFEDNDGVIRRVPLLFRSADLRTGQRTELSMALELAARARGIRPSVAPDDSVSLGDARIPSGAERAMLVNFDGGPGSIPTYSLADLHACIESGKADYFRRHFQGKVVFIGAVLDVEDRKLTSKRFITTPEGAGAPPRCVLPPMQGLYRTDLERDTIPGVYIHAAAVNNMLRGDALRRLGASVDIGLGLALTLILAVPALLLSPLWGGASVLAGIVAWTGAATGAFEFGWVLPLFQPVAAVALTFAGLLGYRFAIADKDKRYLRQAFALYLPPTVVDRLVASNAPPALGGETRELSVFFSDIADFTGISEGLSPQDLVTFLNRYLSVMSDIIERHGGFVDKYIGDAVVAVFGAPLDDPDHALHAVQAALACQARLGEMVDAFALPNERSVETRIGINSGEMLVGNIGSDRRFNYTVMGDAVNLASRLEGANKAFGTRVLVSDRARALCGEAIAFREIDTVRVVGRESPVTVFEPIAPADAVPETEAGRLSAFARALADYRAARFEAAEKTFVTLAASGDGAAASFADRVRRLAAAPPGAGWDGVTDLESK